MNRIDAFMKFIGNVGVFLGALMVWPFVILVHICQGVAHGAKYFWGNHIDWLKMVIEDLRR